MLVMANGHKAHRARQSGFALYLSSVHVGWAVEVGITEERLQGIERIDLVKASAAEKKHVCSAQPEPELKSISGSWCSCITQAWGVHTCRQSQAAID